MADRKDREKTSRALGGFDSVDGFIPFNYNPGYPGPNKASRQRAAGMSAARKKQILGSGNTGGQLGSHNSKTRYGK